jgi:hypothetical protein
VVGCRRNLAGVENEKCCTYYNIDPHISGCSGRMLYEMQELSGLAAWEGRNIAICTTISNYGRDIEGNVVFGAGF